MALVDAGSSSGRSGVISSKTLRETALYFSGLRERGLAGLDYAIRKELEVQDFMYRTPELVRSLRDVHRLRGHARFEDAHTLRVAAPDGADGLIDADVVLIATGSVPRHSPDVPFDDPRIWDTDQVLRLPQVPRTLAVVGGDVVACEYATVCAGLGIFVTLIHDGQRLMPFLDSEFSERLVTAMQFLGMDVRLADRVGRYRPDSDAVHLELASGAAVRVEAVLVESDRLGNTARLGLDTIGLLVDDSAHVAVNEHYQTALPHVYAAGDVTGVPPLTVTAMEQARQAMVHAFDPRPRPRPAALPLTLGTIPEVAMIGETEQGCRDNGVEYGIGKATYHPATHGGITGDLEGQVKLVFRLADKRLLGVHVIGESAGELVQVGAMVLSSGGTIDGFIHAVREYPTLGEVYRYAAYDALDRLQGA